MADSAKSCVHPLNRLRLAQLSADTCECQGCGNKYRLRMVLAWDYPGFAERWKRFVEAAHGLSRDETPLSLFVPPDAIRAFRAEADRARQAPEAAQPQPEASAEDEGPEPAWGRPYRRAA